MMSYIIMSQSITPNTSCSAKFIKPEKKQDPEKIYLNVVRIHNQSVHDQKLNLEYQIPDGWSIINEQNSLFLKAGEKKAIPVKITISKLTLANRSYTIGIMVKDANRSILAQDTSIVHLLPKSDWSMKIAERDQYFREDSIELLIPVFFENRGNIVEAIKLKAICRKEIYIGGFKNAAATYKVDLAPQKDTTLFITVLCHKDFQKLNFTSSISFEASDGVIDVNEMVLFSRLNHYYDNYRPSPTPFSTVLRINNPHKKDLVKTQLISRGQIHFEKDQSLNYNMIFADLNDKEYMAQNNLYDVVYKTGDAKVGFGNASSDYTSHANFSNSLFGEYEFKLDTSNTVSSFVSFNPVNKQSAGVIGHNYSDEKNSATSSVSRSSDDLYKVYKTAASSVGKYALNSNQRIDYKVNILNQETRNQRTNNESGYAHSISYIGRLSDNLNFQTTNVYGTNKYPGSERGVLLLKNILSYVFPKSRFSLQALSSRNRTTPVLYTQSMEELPAIRRENNLYSVSLKSPGTSGFGYSFGPDYSELMVSKEPGVEEETEQSKIRTYSFHGNIAGNSPRFNYTGSFRFGLSENESNTKNTKDLEVISKLQSKSSGMMVKYVNGIQSISSNSTVRRENSLSIAPYYRKSIGSTMTLDLSSSYKYSFTHETGRALVMAKASMMFRNNWSLNVNSTIDWKVDNLYMLNGASLANLNINLSKGMGSTSKLDYYTLDLFFFKDENGNGIMDPEEQAIENMMSMIERTEGFTSAENISPDSQAKINFSFVSLVSNRQGNIKLDYMPEGFYKLRISALQNLNGYFNFKGAEQEVRLDMNKQVYIPYEKAGKVFGKLLIKRDKFSRYGLAAIENIRVVAKTADGKEYSTLTGRNGNFTIFVPQNGSYTISINNPFGSKFKVLKNDIEVDLSDNNNAKVNFIMKEQARKIKYN
jgi:hypothetical protein